jgi:preprotein translocase subunit SecB
MAEENKQPAQQLAIQKLYVKDLSFESPNSPQVFTENKQPNVDMQLHNEANNIGEDVIEAVLTVTITVTAEDKNVYLIEVKQAGIFTISGFTDEQLSVITGTACPNILFPYAREVVSDVVIKGGFPPLVLNPVNFDAIYQQEMARRQADANSSKH